jgi:hypothetical protein
MRSPQFRYLHTGQHKHRINSHTGIRALSEIRTYDPSVWASEDSSCFRPRSHRDRPDEAINMPISRVLWMQRWYDVYAPDKLVTTYENIRHHNRIYVLWILLLYFCISTQVSFFCLYCQAFWLVSHSEWIWDHESYRELVGLLGWVISPVARPLPA